MATTKARTRPSARGNGVRPKTARRAPKPALAAGAAAAGLAGGLLIGSKIGDGLFARRRSSTALARVGAKHLAATAVKAAHTADDIHSIREQLERANHRSPIEVVLDGLTHRPGTSQRRRGLG